MSGSPADSPRSPSERVGWVVVAPGVSSEGLVRRWDQIIGPEAVLLDLSQREWNTEADWKAWLRSQGQENPLPESRSITGFFGRLGEASVLGIRAREGRSEAELAEILVAWGDEKAPIPPRRAVVSTDAPDLPQASLLGQLRRPEVAPVVQHEFRVSWPDWDDQSSVELEALAALWVAAYSGQRAFALANTTRTVEVEVAEGDSLDSLINRLQGNPPLRPASSASLVVQPWTPVPLVLASRSVTSWLGPLVLWTDGEIPGSDPEALSLRYRRVGSDLVMTLGIHETLASPWATSRLESGFLQIVKAFRGLRRAPYESVALVTADEERDLRRVSRGPEPTPAVDVLAAFRRCLQATPEATAVEFEGLTLSYRQLDDLTDGLAWGLHGEGVVKGSRVAVALPRGFHELGVMIAVLKCEAAYIPLDPEHPVERIRVVLEDAKPELLVAPADSPLVMALVPGCRHWTPGTRSSSVPGKPFPSPTPDGASVAYILFTSGSTGRPKGVEVPRRALANFLQSMAREPGLGPQDRVLAITTTTFDISGLELFLPLTVGATVVLADRPTASDPRLLIPFIEKSRLTLMQATPATWRMVLDAGWKGQRNLTMLCGGEALSLALAQRLLEAGAVLWNVYGPTETTIWSTLDQVKSDAEKVTIGRPIDHTDVTLRDSRGRLVPWGTIGEICIGGQGLALGYCDRPDLTAERFLLDSSTGERYYKTGDLGRLLPDGRLECLGRVDFQVKIRGFRVELTDIEAQLRSVPGVREVLVVAHHPPEAEPQLVAYWAGEATRDALFSRAKTQLPYYMVPSSYVHVDEFPLTTAGKIDRKKLPPPEVAWSPESTQQPRSGREAVMVGLWQEVLGLKGVPLDQDFFSLGGTSLRVVELRDRVREAFGVDLSLSILYEHPTVIELCQALEGTVDPENPIVYRLRKGEGPGWVGIMGVHLFADISRDLPVDQPFTAIHLPTRVGSATDSVPSVEEWARRYLNVLEKVQPHGPYRFIGLCYGGVVAFEMACQLEARGERVESVVMLDAELPSARRRHRVRQAIEFLKSPQRLWDWALQKANSRPSVSEATTQDFEHWLRGPGVDVELVRYEILPRRLRAPLVSVRATENGLPPWISIHPDYGWASKTDRLLSRDVGASHLDCVNAPFSAHIARWMVESLDPSGGTGV